ncbi:MAG TPA: response regulator transcription factor [Albitalea sp.]|nr:response regulator transcription factor [Albitalea sp.]
MTASPSTPTRVLLVDDHPLVREGLRARLAGVASLEVVGEAGNAVEAFSVVAEAKPDLVLMDVGMKHVNGIELTAQLLARHPNLWVLMLSMYDNPDYVHRALQVGARGYVLKDAPSQEIITAIEAITAGQVFLSPSISGRMSRSQTPRPLLSQRECEILACIAKGYASKQVAEELGLSTRTVETHRQNIKRKLKLESQGELIKYAVERGWEFRGA